MTDPFRATRRLERFLRDSAEIDIPREPLPDFEKDGTLIVTIVHDQSTGKETIIPNHNINYNGPSNPSNVPDKKY